MLRDAEALTEALPALKAIGLRLVLDDFGTGYSSLGYLTRLPLDAIKIDRSFVDGLGTERRDTAITEAIIAMSQALSLERDRRGRRDAASGGGAARGWVAGWRRGSSSRARCPRRRSRGCSSWDGDGCPRRAGPTAEPVPGTPPTPGSRPGRARARLQLKGRLPRPDRRHGRAPALERPVRDRDAQGRRCRRAGSPAAPRPWCSRPSHRAPWVTPRRKDDLGARGARSATPAAPGRRSRASSASSSSAATCPTCSATARPESRTCGSSSCPCCAGRSRSRRDRWLPADRGTISARCAARHRGGPVAADAVDVAFVVWVDGPPAVALEPAPAVLDEAVTVFVVVPPQPVIATAAPVRATTATQARGRERGRLIGLMFGRCRLRSFPWDACMPVSTA